MPLGKSKTPRRTLLQRLNDQRRSVALAGLAAGAAVAAVFRRRKGGGDPGLGESMPAVAPSQPVPPTAPVAVEAPPATAPAAAPRPAAIVEPATGELSAEEASILAVLAQSGRADDDRTAQVVAASLERDVADVTIVLRKLGAEGVVSDEKRTASDEEIWAVTERGVRRLGAQH